MPLTLAKETMDMNWKDTAASGSSQILLEGDMIVPDSKPDLQEILRCQGNVKIREKRVTDDRISFFGRSGNLCALSGKKRRASAVCHAGKPAP